MRRHLPDGGDTREVRLHGGLERAGADAVDDLHPTRPRHKRAADVACHAVARVGDTQTVQVQRCELRPRLRPAGASAIGAFAARLVVAGRSPDSATVILNAPTRTAYMPGRTSPSTSARRLIDKTTTVAPGGKGMAYRPLVLDNRIPGLSG